MALHSAASPLRRWSSDRSSHRTAKITARSWHSYLPRFAGGSRARESSDAEFDVTEARPARRRARSRFTRSRSAGSTWMRHLFACGANTIVASIASRARGDAWQCPVLRPSPPTSSGHSARRARRVLGRRAMHRPLQPHELHSVAADGGQAWSSNHAA
jgi:hypothetical protein